MPCVPCLTLAATLGVDIGRMLERNELGRNERRTCEAHDMREHLCFRCKMPLILMGE